MKCTVLESPQTNPVQIFKEPQRGKRKERTLQKTYFLGGGGKREWKTVYLVICMWVPWLPCVIQGASSVEGKKETSPRTAWYTRQGSRTRRPPASRWVCMTRAYPPKQLTRCRQRPRRRPTHTKLDNTPPLMSPRRGVASHAAPRVFSSSSKDESEKSPSAE